MAQDSAVQQLLDQVGLKPSDGQRGQMDTVGFASTAEQMDAVVALCTANAKSREDSLRSAFSWLDTVSFRAGVCPHDDYCYAGRLYPLLLSRIHAKRVILFGVFHKAKVFNCQDVLVFDSFTRWHGPHGTVPVSPLREEILRRLPAGDVRIDDDMQQVEHSVEAIVPWLQAFNPDVEIVSILVPYMDWATMNRLAGDLSSSLNDIFREHGWKLGEDVAIICSSDAVHYGDADWGGSNYATFGTDIAGYEQAVRRDMDLATHDLAGNVNPTGLHNFFESCVDPDDVYQYRITWCGRFSIPFGLSVAASLANRLGEPPLDGILLDYGTSVSEATLPLDSLAGMGRTAPNNLHHWVGYAALGYR
ncbi:MAG: AmmeMemoRadiSam system protein B [bacterium]